MTYFIENEFIKVGAENAGAELTSIYSKKTNTEYLWQRDGKYWDNAAPNLFPICGRLDGGCYTWQGKTYNMDIHGFAKDSEFVLESKTDSEMTFLLKSSAQTRSSYPFEFEFRVYYALEGSALINKYIIKNCTDGEMYYSVGGHPGFNAPFDANEDFTDMYIQFKESARPMHVNMKAPGYCTGGAVAFGVNEKNRYPLHHDMFDNDGIFMYGTDHGISLRSTKSDKFVTIEYPDMDYVGLWHRPMTDAPYICMEPWGGMPSDLGKIDDLTEKKAMARIEAGETDERVIKITVL